MPAIWEKTTEQNLHADIPPCQAAQGRTPKILLTDTLPDEQTAWSKARGDVLRLAVRQGYRAVRLPTDWNPRTWLAFMRIMRTQLEPGGHVLVEYPLAQRKRLYPLLALCRWRNIRLQGLIHDLDSLRSPGSGEGREIAVLRLFDGLISHNPSMSAWLRHKGISKRMVDLNLFDYLSAGGPPWHEDTLERLVRVVCAGNLEYGKAQYVYHAGLQELQNVEFSLYGAYFEADRPLAANVRYKGLFKPDSPRLDRRHHFGLVWDGADIDGCTGTFGDYLRINNPHKLSLYLSMGLPVIVWSESAVAGFVQEHGIGVAVTSLREIDGLAERIGSANYLDMATRATAMGERLRSGGFLRDALARLLQP
jgi:hypothetical protein